MTLAIGLDFGQSECRLAYVANGQPVAVTQATQLSQIWTNKQGVSFVPEAQAAPNDLTDIERDIKSLLGDTPMGIDEALGPARKPEGQARPRQRQDERAVLRERLTDLKRAHRPANVNASRPRTSRPPRVDAVSRAAQIMEVVRQAGERQIGQSLHRAVIVVPAHAREPQRAATRVAAQAAGFSETRLLSETLAAVIADHAVRGEGGWYLVYHWGAGPFEASVIRIEGQRYEVRSVIGDRKARGDKFDENIARRVVDQLRVRHLYSKADRVSSSHLLHIAETIKIDLSRTKEWVKEYDIGRATSKVVIRRAEFEQWIRPEVERTFELARQALVEADLNVSDLEAILAVGGTTAIPLVGQMCRDAFGLDPVRLDRYAVARGAAIHAQTIPEEEWAVVVSDTPVDQT